MAAMEIELEKFRRQYKIHKIFSVGGVKTRVSRVSGSNKNFFKPYSLHKKQHSHQLPHIEFSQ